MKDILVQNLDIDHVLKQNKIKFPIKTLQDLRRIEGLLGEPNVIPALRKFFKDLKPTDKSRPSSAGLAKIIADDLLVNFNWRGVAGKQSLEKFDFFGRILFGEWKFSC